MGKTGVPAVTQWVKNATALWGLAPFFLKEQLVNVFGFAQLSVSSAIVLQKRPDTMNEHGCVLVKLYSPNKLAGP